MIGYNGINPNGNSKVVIGIISANGIEEVTIKEGDSSNPIEFVYDSTSGNYIYQSGGGNSEANPVN